MKKLILYFCLILSLAGFTASQEQSKNVSEQPCLNDIREANRRRPSGVIHKTKNLFKKIFGMRRAIYDYFPPACIKDIVLSQTEVLEACSLPKTTTTYCPENKQSIKVSVVAFNLNNDVLSYDYKVSGGEIIGKGSNVTWELSNAKPGVYTISASVDNGYGLLNTITKEVKVAECPDCRWKIL